MLVIAVHCAKLRTDRDVRMDRNSKPTFVMALHAARFRPVRLVQRDKVSRTTFVMPVHSARFKSVRLVKQDKVSRRVMRGHPSRLRWVRLVRLARNCIS
jgi:hypothetical protein